MTRSQDQKPGKEKPEIEPVPAVPPLIKPVPEVEPGKEEPLQVPEPEIAPGTEPLTEPGKET